MSFLGKSKGAGLTELNPGSLTKLGPLPERPFFLAIDKAEGDPGTTRASDFQIISVSLGCLCWFIRNCQFGSEWGGQ